MSDRDPFGFRSGHAGGDDFAERDDVLGVLSAPQSLSGQTSHTVVRACLEQAHDDILHLTACVDGPRADDGEANA
jgi:hypothetical protein